MRHALKSWGVTVNDAFFLGGVSKAKILEILKPHIFFDDQTKHLLPATTVAPCVHVPFGVTNTSVPEIPDERSPDAITAEGAAGHDAPN
ncbi:5'-nucleotidase [Rhodococcus indonesiensis]|uniref:5'-nucleotidase n=1 Tax=Rhodococcus indonesiensis TaxID=3055869 RepID=UPI0039F6DDEE